MHCVLALLCSRASDLVFEEAQWEALRDRLTGMGAHVSELLAALKSEVGEGEDADE